MAERVLLLATKDTIAYRPTRSTVASGEELLNTIPAHLLPADVAVENIAAEPSWDTSPTTMLTLARRARAAILQDGFDGVVVTHGTDTIEDTAFLADLLAGPATERGTIVLTGAVRHLDEPSTDGPRNLAAALTTAVDPTLRGAGVLVCANDELHAARWVTYVDALSVAAFSSAPHPPLARLVRGRIQPLGTPPPRPPRAPGEPEPDVALIKTYPGMDAALLSAAVDAGARGVVLEGTGPGNVPASLLATISDLVEWDIPVVVASRCGTGAGGLGDSRPTDGLAAGVGAIGARGLAPTKARVALMVALGAGGTAAVRDWFARL